MCRKLSITIIVLHQYIINNSYLEQLILELGTLPKTSIFIVMPTSPTSNASEV